MLVENGFYESAAQNTVKIALEKWPYQNAC